MFVSKRGFLGSANILGIAGHPLGRVSDRGSLPTGTVNNWESKMAACDQCYAC